MQRHGIVSRVQVSMQWNMKNYNSKVYTNYSILYNQPIPDKLNDKITDLFSHRKQMKAKKEELQYVKVQPCTIAG